MLMRALYSLLYVSVIVTIGFSAPAFAQESKSDESYEELTQQAQTLFEQGEYDQSIALLNRAYELKDNPNILYNVARIYEEKGALNEALDYYERFVVAPKVDLNYRKEALERIKTIREILELQEKPAEEPEEVVEEPEPEVPTAESSPWTGVGIGMAITGGVAMITGGVFGILANGAESDFQDSTNLEEARGFADDASTYSAVADGLIIGGAVLGIGGVLLAVLSGNETNDTAALEITPTVGRKSVGASLQWTF